MDTKIFPCSYFAELQINILTLTPVMRMAVNDPELLNSVYKEVSEKMGVAVNGKSLLKEPKTAARNRTLDVPAPLMQKLREHQ